MTLILQYELMQLKEGQVTLEPCQYICSFFLSKIRTPSMEHTVMARLHCTRTGQAQGMALAQ